MKALKGGGKKSPNRFKQQRNGLLGIVHIAKDQLGLSRVEYEDILSRYRVTSAAAMSVPELENLVKYFETLGFKKKPGSVGPKRWKLQNTNQVQALQDRIRSTVQDMENGEARMTGLVKAKCGVDDLRFCRDVGKLKQVLRVMTLIKDQNHAKAQRR